MNEEQVGFIDLNDDYFEPREYLMYWENKETGEKGNGEALLTFSFGSKLAQVNAYIYPLRTFWLEKVGEISG